TTTGRPEASRRRLFLEHLLPALQVEVPHRAVQVDRRLFHALEELVVQRAVVDGFTDLHADLVRKVRDEIVERIHRAVHAPADPVPDCHWSDERYYEIRTGPEAPDAERLTEVFPARLEVPGLGRVEEAPKPERAVNHESRNLAERAFPLALQQAVHEARDPRDIREAVVDHDLGLLGHHGAVPAGDRLQKVFIEVVVEREHLL